MFSGLSLKQKWMAVGFGAVGAVGTVALLIGLWTAYVDHERTTAMWLYVNQQIAAKQTPTK